MEGLIVAAVIVVAWWLVQYVRARRITRTRATQLSQKTGVPAERIHQQMQKEQLTPGEWAAREGFDPITFEPTDARHELAEWWERIRLRPGDPVPPKEHGVRILTLHRDLMALLAEPATLPTEASRLRHVLQELHNLGSRVDAELVNGVLEKLRRETDGKWSPELRTQAEYDELQQRMVRGREG